MTLLHKYHGTTTTGLRTSPVPVYETNGFFGPSMGVTPGSSTVVGPSWERRGVSGVDGRAVATGKRRTQFGK